VLEEEEPVARLTLVSNLLSRELQLAEMQAKNPEPGEGGDVQEPAGVFLREQMKAIKQELGTSTGNPRRPTT